MILFPRASGEARKCGWTIDPDFLEKIRDTLEKIGISEFDDDIPEDETIESILLAVERLNDIQLRQPHMHKPAYILKNRGIVVIDKRSVANATESEFEEATLLLPLNIVAQWSDEAAQQIASMEDDHYDD